MNHLLTLTELASALESASVEDLKNEYYLMQEAKDGRYSSPITDIVCKLIHEEALSRMKKVNLEACTGQSILEMLYAVQGALAEKAA